MRPNLKPIPDPSKAPAGMTTSPEFLSWFQRSTVRDALGNPLMVFHGTARLNRAFGTRRHRDAEGAYFSSSFEEAKIYADMDSEIEGYQPYVISAFIRLSNPFPIYGIDSHEITEDLRDKLLLQGFDGVIGLDPSTGSILEYIVFHPGQIAQFHGGRIEIPELHAPKNPTPRPISECSPCR